MTLTARELRRYTASPYARARRQTRVVMVGDVAVGGDNPIRVQSMTTTRTLDTEATVAQAVRLVEAGCEIVRITAPTVNDARNLGQIRAYWSSVTVVLQIAVAFTVGAFVTTKFVGATRLTLAVGTALLAVAAVRPASYLASAMAFTAPGFSSDERSPGLRPR